MIMKLQNRRRLAGELGIRVGHRNIEARAAPARFPGSGPLAPPLRVLSPLAPRSIARIDASITRGRSMVDALLDTLPNDEASRRDWLVWRAFERAAVRSQPLQLQYRRSMALWLDAAAEAIVERAACTPDEARLGAELVVAVVDSIANAAAIDPESWPVERQRAILEYCLARVLPS